MKRKLKSKVCDYCKKEFFYVDERTNRIRKYCSLDCCSKSRIIPQGLKKKRIERSRYKKCLCGNERKSRFSKICIICSHKKKKEEFNERIKQLTVNDCLIFSKNYSANNKYQNIRNLAKSVIRWNDIEKKCKICGYDKHVEVCHIKQISEFSLDTTIDIVNAISNLVCLCPNHHWEFDNKLTLL